MIIKNEALPANPTVRKFRIVQKEGNSEVKSSGKLLGIVPLDHVIFTKDDYFSLNDENIFYKYFASPLLDLKYNNSTDLKFLFF